MPERSGWVLRPAAEDDLSNIWLEGAASWGVEQAERYADGLFALFDLLCQFPEIARERTEFSPAVRIHPSGAHLVIYRQTETGIEIIRILHGHQNLTAYLSDG
jgi:toxin ParE1/3/4